MSESRITQTLVFQFSSHEERKAVLGQFEGMLFADTTPRVIAMSVDNEQRRAELMLEAVYRFDDHHDIRDAIVALYEASDLHDWSWEKYEADDS